MNKKEVVDSIANLSGLDKEDASKAYDAFIDTLKNAFKAEDEVSIIGFGNFSVETRPAHKGINPRTKEEIEIAEKKVVKFKPSKSILD